MPAVQIRPNVYWIGVNDRTTDLFEGIWPIEEEGVSYNSYLILDRKKVLIDLSKALKTDEFFHQIQELTPLSELDYIVLNHLEPDHTGVILTLRQLAPRAVILGSAKMQEMLASFYKIRENVRAVADGEVLDIGSRKLQFFSAPFVHWPETMVTFDTAEKILFSCDAFGGYGALEGTIFDDESRNLAFYEQESLRYYVNIVAKFSKPVLNAIAKLAGLDIRIIAPSHGLIWRARTRPHRGAVQEVGRVRHGAHRAGHHPDLRLHVREHREGDGRGGPRDRLPRACPSRSSTRPART